MVRGFRTLPMLCKKTHAFPADIVDMVHQCLRVYVGTRCPLWLAPLFVQHLQCLGPDSEMILTAAAQHVDVADNKDADVMFKFTVYPGGILWDLECKHRGVMVLQSCGMSLDCHPRGPSILDCLKECRKSMCHLSEPLGSLEVPNCFYDWGKLLRLWIFGGACAEADTTCDIRLLNPPWFLD